MNRNHKDLILRISSDSAERTKSLGRAFAGCVKEKEVVILEGELGGGKTTFMQGVLNGLGCKDYVQSPSFTLMRRYFSKEFTVYHLDLYRLNAEDVFGLGIDDFLYAKKTVVFIEWGDKISNDLNRYICLNFSFINENSRAIGLYSEGYRKRRKEELKRIKA